MLEDSTLIMTGGQIQNLGLGVSGSQNIPGGTIDISGGTVGKIFANSGSTVNITGGVIQTIDALADSFVHLSVTDLFLDGMMVDLMLGETLEITQRGGSILNGALADGTLFDYNLNESISNSGDIFDTNATLTATLVPTPGVFTSLALGGLMVARRRRRNS